MIYFKNQIFYRFFFMSSIPMTSTATPCTFAALPGVEVKDTPYSQGLSDRRAALESKEEAKIGRVCREEGFSDEAISILKAAYAPMLFEKFTVPMAHLSVYALSQLDHCQTFALQGPNIFHDIGQSYEALRGELVVANALCCYSGAIEQETAAGRASIFSAEMRHCNERLLTVYELKKLNLESYSIYHPGSKNTLLYARVNGLENLSLLPF